MAHFEALGEEMVNMYKDRYALLANLRTFFRDLKGSVSSFREECRRAQAEQKRELTQMLKQANAKRKREVAQMIRGFVEMLRNFREETAERAASWRQVVASMAGTRGGSGRAEASLERSSPTGRRPGRRKAAEAES